MKLSDILIGAACVLEMKARTKPEALAELAEGLAGAVPGLERERLLAMLREREQLGSTALGGGIAIPHARLDSAGRMLASFARSRERVGDAPGSAPGGPQGADPRLAPAEEDAYDIPAFLRR